MKKGFIIATLLVVLVSSSVFAQSLVGKKIYIDPGHGGSDPGSVGGSGLTEARITLQIGLVLRDCLVEYGGATVRMSRTTDTAVSLAARVSDANNWGAHRFISLHYAFHAVDDGFSGTATYSHPNASTVAHDLRNKMHARLDKGNLRDLGPLTADFYVLRNTQMPAILTEVAYLTTPEVEARLRDPNYIWNQGYQLYLGFCNHYAVKSTY